LIYKLFFSRENLKKNWTKSKFDEEDNEGIYQIIDPQFDLDYIAQPDNAIIKFFYQVNTRENVVFHDFYFCCPVEFNTT